MCSQSTNRFFGWIAGFQSALGGRRFLITLLFGLVNAALVYLTKLSSHDYMLITGGTIAAYIAGNTWEANKSKGDEK
jgi:hypothetical protein